MYSWIYSSFPWEIDHLFRGAFPGFSPTSVRLKVDVYVYIYIYTHMRIHKPYSNCIISQVILWASWLLHAPNRTPFGSLASPSDQASTPAMPSFAADRWEVWVFVAGRFPSMGAPTNHPL